MCDTFLLRATPRSSRQRRVTSQAVAPSGTLRWLRMGVVRLTAFAIVVNVAISMHSPYVTSPWTASWVTAVVIVVLGVPSVAVLVAAMANRVDFGPLRMFVVAGVVANLLVVAGPHHGTPPAGSMYLNASTTVATCVSAFVWRSRRVTALWIVALTASFAAVMTPAVGVVVAVLQASVSMVGSIVLAFLGQALAGVYREVEQTELQRRLLGEKLAAHQELRWARERWDRLLHDKVLGALTMASRAMTPTSLASARVLAGDSLAALGVIKPTPGAGGEPMESHVNAAFGLGVERRGEMPVGLPPAVVTALEAATGEALLNVAKHAGVSSAVVAVTGDAQAVTVTIDDRGRGFAAADRRGPGRFGLGRSVPGHLASVGGRSVVISTPGEGTTVTLSWRATVPAPHPPSNERATHIDYRLGRWRAGVILGPLWTTLHAAVGLASSVGLWLPRYDTWPPAFWLAAALLVGAAALVTIDRAGAQAMAVIITAITVVYLVRRTPLGTVVDWRMWFVGATLPIGFMTVMSGRFRLTWLYAALIPTAMVLGWRPWGWGIWARHWELLVGPAIVMAVAALARGMLSRAQRQLSHATEQLIRTHRANQSAALEEQAARHRREALSTRVIPLLTRIWAANVLTAADRRAAALAEAEGRDHLMADALVDESMAVAARAARARGARVDLRAFDAPDSGELDVRGGRLGGPATDGSPGISLPSLVHEAKDPTAALTRFRRLVTLGLGDCTESSRLTAQWYANATDRAATLVIEGPRDGVDCTAYQQVLAHAPHLLDISPEEIWVEIHQ